MPIVIEAVFEDGVLKPTAPLQLEERERVTLTVHMSPSLAQQTAGIVPWTGDVETLERIATEPEFGLLESR